MEISELRDAIMDALKSEDWKSLNEIEIDSSGSIRFVDTLNCPLSEYDLQNLGTALLSLALSLREKKVKNDQKLIRDAFNFSGKALKIAVEKNEIKNNNKIFLSILSSCAFKLGEFTNSSRFMIKNSYEKQSRMEKVLSTLIRLTCEWSDKKYETVYQNRFFNYVNTVHFEIRQWNKEENINEHSLRERLQNWLNDVHTQYEHEFIGNENSVEKLEKIIEKSIILNYFSGIKILLYEIKNGKKFDISKEMIEKSLRHSAKLNFMDLWWYSRLTVHLIDEISENGFQQNIQE